MLINGLAGAISVILANMAYELLPLTIWFVLVCTLPFSLAIMQYLYLGERMALVSIIASIISFVAIILLSFAKPKTGEVSEKESNYVLGVLISVLCVILFSMIGLTTRIM